MVANMATKQSKGRAQTAKSEAPAIRFTAANARKLSGFDGKVDAAIADISDRVGKNKRERGFIAHDAATLAYWVIYTADLIGKAPGKAGGVAEGKRWATQGDYAAALNYSESYGTLLRKLATFAVDWEIPATDRAWAFLVQKGNDSKVAAILKSADMVDPTTRVPTDKGRSALADLVAEYEAGTFVGGPRKAQPEGHDTSTGKQSEDAPGKGGDSGESSEVRKPMSLTDLVEALAHTVRHGGPDGGPISDEEWADLRPTLLSIVEREDQTREHEAKRLAEAV